MKEEGVKRTFLFAYFAIGVAQFCEIAFNYLLYKTFSVGEVGVFAWAAAIVVFFNMTVDLGVEPVLTRKFGYTALSVKQAYVATYLPRLPIMVGGLATLFILFTQELLDTRKFLLLLLIGGQSLFNISDGICKAWLRASSRQTYANLIATGIGILKLLAILLLVRSEDGSIVALMAVLLLVRAIISAITAIYVRYRFRPVGETEVVALSQLTISMLRSGIVIGGIGFLTAIQNRLDWLLVSFFASTSALAGYSLANKFYEIAQVFVGASLTTVYPWLCRSRPMSQTLSIILRLVIATGVLVGTIGASCAPWLISILFGDKYANAEQAVVILMVAVGLMASSGILYQVLLANGLESSLLRVTAITTSLQAVCNLFLINWAGITGAATGMLLLVFLTTVGLSWLVRVHSVMNSNVLWRILKFLSVYLAWSTVTLFLDPSVFVTTVAGLLVVFVFSWTVLFESDEKKLLVQKTGALIRSLIRSNLH